MSCDPSLKEGLFEYVIAAANSFTLFAPGHVHLKDLGQLVAMEIERVGGVAKESNTVVVDSNRYTTSIVDGGLGAMA